MSRPSTPWLSIPRPNPQARLRLFCFPYAGGGAAAYRPWLPALPAGVEACLVQLPGREARFREPPFDRLGPLVDALAPALRPYLDRPFALFGHSMGALIAYELTRHLRRQGGPLPAHLFVSGRGAPHTKSLCPPLNSLPDPVLREELRRLSGTPPEILDNDDLMSIFIPLLRADFAVVETYCHEPRELLPCPITCYGGREDTAWDLDRMEAWREHTAAAFRLRMFPGNHFFINTQTATVLQVLGEELAALEAPARRAPDWPAIAPPPLAADEVHVWRAALDCDDATLGKLRTTLADDELRRAERFHFDKDRWHFTAGRGLLRAVLGHYLRREPKTLPFGYHVHGKPFLADADVRFNLSHSHGLALVAVTRGREVGVDIERVRPDFGGEAVAERFFSPAEVQTLRSLPPAQRQQAFFTCWTRKEAYIKATGQGLSLGLDSFDVTLAPDQPAALLATRPDPGGAARWSLRALSPAESYVGAVAAQGRSWRLWCGQWQQR